ncbi:FAD-binding monooxygenase [Jimgerdemannia flammicorona]|uniref:FAD-binding monooxygenase n=1 Tax=Jimgerdemannia flammicorona TaxID=994334 RepID=A0A433QZC3_9FUNG|nr:FAD-binding monooxygenase [Jimgerdemannia flammicorona]
MECSYSSVDVLIVGAGPVGLFAAFNLLRYGFSVRIIVERYGRAAMLHSRTLELLHQSGLSETFLQEGRKSHKMWIVTDGEWKVMGPPLHALRDTEFKYSLILRQFMIEQLLTEKLAEYGVQVERSIELVDFDVQDEDGSVSAVLKGT